MFSVIIPMAGCGVRSGLKMNKALWELNGKPLFMHSVDMFKKYDCEIILVCSKSDIKEVREYTDLKIVLGGSSRAESVYNGISNASNSLCLIHDAARPFLDDDMITSILDAMKDNKCAYVGIEAIDTIRNINGGVVDRNNLVLVQTPQALYKEDYIKAYEMSLEDNSLLTDDISYLERYLGYKPKLIKGNRFNMKLTTPEDFKLAEIVGGIK